MSESAVIKQTRVPYEVNHNTEAGMPEAQKKAVLAREQQIRNNKDESLHAYDDSGNEVSTIQGSGNRVRVSRDEYQAQLAKLNDTVVTHNHPTPQKKGVQSIGNSFSKEDLMTAIGGNAREVRAVSPRYTFSIKRPANGWGMTGTQASRIYAQASKNVIDKARDYLDKLDWSKTGKERVYGTIADQINKEFVRLAREKHGVNIVYRHKNG